MTDITYCAVCNDCRLAEEQTAAMTNIVLCMFPYLEIGADSNATYLQQIKHDIETCIQEPIFMCGKCPHFDIQSYQSAKTRLCTAVWNVICCIHENKLSHKNYSLTCSLLNTYQPILADTVKNVWNMTHRKV